MPRFCRHNRLTVECPICSKEGLPGNPRPRPAPRPRAERRHSAARTVSGVHASAGPYEDGQGGRYEVRLERVPGGLRLAEWAVDGGELRRRAPVLAAADLPRLIGSAIELGVVAGPDAERLRVTAEPPGPGVSRGRSGELWEELRVERVEGERLRIARWLERPGSGWERQEAPVMLPAARLAEAISGAGEGASRAAVSGPSGPVRP